MSAGARITAFLGLDISSFQAGLEKANIGAEKFKRVLTVGDIGNGIKGLIGGGAVIATLREAVEHATELRREAREAGRELDQWTAAVARFGDAWEGTRNTGAGIRDTVVGALNLLGENLVTGSSLWAERMGLKSAGSTFVSDAAAEGADSAEGRLMRSRKNIPAGFMRDFNRQESQIAESRSSIGASDEDQLASILKQRDALRAEAESMTSDTDFVEKHKLILAADKLDLDYQKKISEMTDRVKKTDEQIADLRREQGALGETTQEHINRLLREADQLQVKAWDQSLPIEQREDARLKRQEKITAAAKAEYEWKNKPLTVAEAAAGGNTTSVGVQASRIQSYQDKANAFRAQGNFDAAARYDKMASDEQDKFDRDARDKQEAARKKAASGDKDRIYGPNENAAPPSDWDRRNAAAIATRSAILNMPVPPTTAAALSSPSLGQQISGVAPVGKDGNAGPKDGLADQLKTALESAKTLVNIEASLKSESIK